MGGWQGEYAARFRRTELYKPERDVLPRIVVGSASTLAQLAQQWLDALAAGARPFWWIPEPAAPSTEETGRAG